MTTPTNPQEPAPDSRTLTIRVGALTLTKYGAALALVLILGLLTALLVWIRPTLRMSISAALWILFVAYWSAAAKSAAPPVSQESRASRAVHTRLLNASLLLLFLPVPGLRGRFLPLTAWGVGSGLGLQAIGFAFAAWARRHLGRHWSGAVALASNHQLVRSGPYRLIRHPIYSAMFAMYVGTSLVSGELHALLALALLGAAYWRKIPQEERALSGVFGAEYESYRRETWALIPGLL